MIVAVVGIAVLRFSRASGSQGIMLPDSPYTRHDGGEFTSSADGIAWTTSVNNIGPGTWQWYGPFEKLTVWPNDAAKSVVACWTLRDNLPYGIQAEYALDITADNGAKVLGSRMVRGQEGAFKTVANSLTQQCLSANIDNGYYDLNRVEYRLSMRRGSVSIFRANRQLVGAITSDMQLATSFPAYIWPLLPGVGSVRGPDAQGGGCWGGPRPGRPHNGLDIFAPDGSQVISVQGGTVVNIDNPPDPAGFGRFLIVKNDDGRYALYGHVKDVRVGVGERVAQGQWIASVSNTGNAEGVGSQLHLQIQTNYNGSASTTFGQTINPASILPQTRLLNGCTL